MAAYHTTWDLGHLALTPENYALAPLGKVAAHLIAGTFLVLVGIGLVLMNRDGLRPRAFLLRLARIGIAALLITAATVYAFPDSFIFFGILHCIAVSSVLAVPFLRVSPAVALVVGIVVLATPAVMANPDYHLAVFDDPILSFLGLGMVPPRTNDYVPLFPWFGLVLLGLAAARLGLPGFPAHEMGDVAAGIARLARAGFGRAPQPRRVSRASAGAARPARGRRDGDGPSSEGRSRGVPSGLPGPVRDDRRFRADMPGGGALCRRCPPARESLGDHGAGIQRRRAGEGPGSVSVLLRRRRRAGAVALRRIRPASVSRGRSMPEPRSPSLEPAGLNPWRVPRRNRLPSG